MQIIYFSQFRIRSDTHRLNEYNLSFFIIRQIVLYRDRLCTSIDTEKNTQKISHVSFLQFFAFIFYLSF